MGGAEGRAGSGEARIEARGDLEVRWQPARAVGAQKLGKRGRGGVVQPVFHVDEGGLGAVESAREGGAAEKQEVRLDGELPQ